jgi:hypothetical protein
MKKEDQHGVAVYINPQSKSKNYFPPMRFCSENHNSLQPAFTPQTPHAEGTEISVTR